MVYGLFGLLFLCWFTRGVIQYFKKQVFLPSISIVFLNVFPVFKSQVFWGLASATQNPRVGVLDIELESLALQGKVLCH